MTNYYGIFSICYIEFETVQAAQDALVKDGMLFKGRQLTVMSKRKNAPGRGRARRNDFRSEIKMLANAFTRGRGGRGGRGRGMMGGPFGGRGGGRGMPRGGAGGMQMAPGGTDAGAEGEPK